MPLKIKSQEPTVLQVIPELQTGGAEKTAVDVSIALKGLGWRPIIASAGGRLTDQIIKAGVEHFTLPLASKNPLTVWRNVARLQRLIGEEKVDIVHARSRAPAWSAYSAARRLDIPFVTTYHGAYGQTNSLKAFYNSVMSKGDVVIGNSQWTAELVKARYPDIAERVVAIPRGTDFSAFEQSRISDERRRSIRDSWGVSESDFVVLLLARLSPLKDHRTVIKAASEIIKTKNNFRFVFAGDAQGRDAYRDELVNQIEALGLQEIIKLPGHCDDPAAALAVCDVALSASRQPETFGRVAVEAGALERPVVVTNIGAVGETVLAVPDVKENQRTGWKIEPEQPDQLRDVLLEMAALTPRQRAVIGKRARNYVTQHFSLDVMCEATIKLYKQLLSS